MFKKRVKLSTGKDVKRRKLEPQVESKETLKKIPPANESESDDEIDIIVKPRTNIGNDNRSDSEDDSEIDNNENEKSTLATFLNKPKQVGSSGQIKQSKNLHTTILVDYQPDICKDFAKTGFCGYGDNCKFLHSREDFKSGWKLNKDWVRDGDDDTGSGNAKIENEIKDIPFKCVICENGYSNPVVTICNHYFCRKCFFQRIKDNGNNKCAICGENTHGTAKIATNLKTLLTKRRESTQESSDK
ncbi:pre-mRNA-splicing factor Cwc24p [Monosporozyma unispora]|nr:RNA-splicing factor [Kazachstania unispora]